MRRTSRTLESEDEVRTVLKEENEAVIERFLQDGEFALYTPEFPYGFVRDGVLKTYPQDGTDGFFAAAFRRKS